ncbi:MAG: 1-deoxy-D-xylulose-5-phosphate reductoisomerase [Coriobacteriales bacterium]|jgi:1-deoxy-D-xylulose-5-phosphate reductoisomerase
MKPVDLTLLGSSGSIGRQTLDVARQHRDAIRVVGLSVNRSVDMLVEQAREFGVKHVVIADESMEGHPALSDLPSDVSIGWGKQAVEELASTNPDPEPGRVDTVLNSLVGIAGLRASHAALASGRRLALANKESLVVGGELLMPMCKPGQLLPVDSEHSAIFQCLIGEKDSEVARIWITASGGPFRGRTRDQLEKITVDDALAHPTWSMGPKITIDSSTLMNKGLEVIEAYHLFCCDFDHISVVVHPQSRIHSMVEFVDGSVKAQIGPADMRIPIQLALSYPDRWDFQGERLDFTQLSDLTFEAPDTDTFGCLALALEAGREGGTATTVLNAANEVAVASFLSRSCGYLDIERTVGKVLSYHDRQPVESLEQIEEVDEWARARAHEILGA